MDRMPPDQLGGEMYHHDTFVAAGVRHRGPRTHTTTTNSSDTRIPSSASSSSIDSASTLLEHHSIPKQPQHDSDMSDTDQQQQQPHEKQVHHHCFRPALASITFLSDSTVPTVPTSVDIVSSHKPMTETADDSMVQAHLHATTATANSCQPMDRRRTAQEPFLLSSPDGKGDRGDTTYSIEAASAIATTTTTFASSTTSSSSASIPIATATPSVQARSSSSVRTFLAPLTPLAKPSSSPSSTAQPPASSSSINQGSTPLRRSSSSSIALSKLGLAGHSLTTNHHATSNSTTAGATAAASGSSVSSAAMTSLAKKRRLNLLRVRIERGLVVSMALLASYRIMSLQEDTLLSILPSVSNTTTTAWTLSGGHQWQQKSYPYAATTLASSGKILVKNAFALGAALLLLVTLHALVLHTHDHRLEFSLHNKIMPLQPITKRSSRLFKDADDDDEDEDESEEDDGRLTKEEWMEQEVLLLAQGQDSGYHASQHHHHSSFLHHSSLHHGAHGGDLTAQSVRSQQQQQSRARSLNWRVFGTEPHWYRKGVDNGSIFATVLVPVVLISKFFHVIQEYVFSGTVLSIGDVKTLETLLCSLSLSLTFGFSILVHMVLLKVFEDHRDLLSPRPKESAVFAENGTMLDSLYLLPEAMAQATSTGTRIHGSNGSPSSSLYPRQTYQHHLEASMGPSPAPSTTISTSATPSNRSVSSSPVLSATRLAPPPLSSSAIPSSKWNTVERTMSHHSQHESQHDTNSNPLLFSSDQLIHPSFLVGTSETEQNNDREEKWILALGVGGAYTFGLMLLTRFQWLPGLERTSAGMVMLTQSVFQLLMLFSAHFFKRSFTFGEMAVLAQAVTLMVHETLIMYFGHDTLVARSTNKEQRGHAQELMPGSFHSPQFMFMLTLIVGMMMIGLLLSPLLVYCRRLAQLPRKGLTSIDVRRHGLKKRMAAAGVYLGMILTVGGVIMPQTSQVLGQNPFQWLVDFMLMTTVDWRGMWAQASWWANSMLFGPNSTATLAANERMQAATEAMSGKAYSAMDLILSIGWKRVLLCMYWVLAVTVSILFLEWMKTSARRRAIMGSLNNRRKFYHALAVLMFTPGFLLDKPFMHLAFSVAVASMIFLEYIRYFAVYPVGKEIHLFLVGFLDDRDRGPIILSHLYLLIGCATPVWLAGQDVLAGLSGIFALGFGDAMASIVGRRWGRHRWPGTVKTVEGTAAFVASILVAAGVIQMLMWLFVQDQTLSPVLDSLVKMQTPAGAVERGDGVVKVLATMVLGAVGAIARYGLAVSGAAMLEAVSEQNDNLVIPVAMLAVVWLL